jgi:hypothetical protein
VVGVVTPGPPGKLGNHSAARFDRGHFHRIQPIKQALIARVPIGLPVVPGST